ncbi:exonuclease domain-containing protein [Aneurinibacillus migulanus]|uniref:exonuclease domain-containing protein n=1 Tax=Aneurinibacillus migulanus TaxID=47500 RepID=UPI00069613CB|nr:exonuclease domain-containing protein [Aneurinibacillus migulanus]
MKESNGLFARISQMLARGIGKQHMGMFYGQGGADLRQEAWTRSLLQESQRHADLLQTPLRELVYTSVDIETTGFYPERGAEVISIAAIRMNGREIAHDDLFSVYVRPSGCIPDHITVLTGITENMVAEAPPLGEVFASFEAFLTNTIVIGYYIGHELKFFNHFLWRSSYRRFTHRTLEMKKVAECLYPQLTEHRMEDVLEWAGISIKNRHHAQSDVRMTAELWSVMQKSLEIHGVQTLADLYVYLTHKGK